MLLIRPPDTKEAKVRGELRFNEGEGWVGPIGYQRFQRRVTNRVELTVGLFALDLRLISRSEEVDIETAGLRFDTFLATRIKTAPITVRWGRNRRRAQRRFMFAFAGNGSCRLETDGGFISDPTGRFFIIPPGSSPVDLVAADAHNDVILFTIDRSELGPDGARIAEIDALPPTSAVVRATYSYLAGLVLPDADDDAGSAEVIRELTRSIARALVKDAARKSRPGRSSFDDLSRMISKTSHHPDLDASKLAEMAGISRRTLERQFEERGTSVARAIRTDRSRRALEMIVSDPSRSIQDIAGQSGFGSPAALRSAFQKSYGRTPAQLKAAIARGEADFEPSRDL